MLDDTQETKPSAAEALDAWMMANIHDTAVAQNTEKFNRVFALVQQIKQEIQDII